MGGKEMAKQVREAIDSAVDRIDQAMSASGDIGHEEVAAAVRDVICVRDTVLRAVRSSELPADRLQEINAIVSLAFGTAFPLIGVHLHRFEQARDALRSLAGRLHSA
jgi:hypothetical protein